MQIARRTSGGRGEFELPGGVSGLTARDADGKELILRLPGALRVRLGLTINYDQGKPRIVRMDGTEVQVQKQLAALLLLPSSVRSDDAMLNDQDVLAGGHVLESVEVRTAETDATTFTVRLGEVRLRNAITHLAFQLDTRFRRVRAVWANAGRFAPEVSALLEQHRERVLAGTPLGTAEERLVADLGLLAGDRDPLRALDQVPTELATALGTKPFAILTGPAGTGKSRHGIELGLWLDYGAGLPAALEASRQLPATSLALVPVGADWTDQRHLLGFRNAFGAPRTLAGGSVSNLTYEVTQVVRLMLRAQHPEFREDPHVLLLDEMNLSHVERYFSSFLSIMEADRAVTSAEFFLIPQHDVDLIADVLQAQGGSPLEVESARALVAEGRGLAFPKNVFIVGTVNVDETTYMFSPKVLDRAFVREVRAVDPLTALGAASAPKTAPGAAVLEVLQQAIARASGASGLQDPLAALRAAAGTAGLAAAEVDALADATAKALAGTFKLLAPVGFSFGYRTLHEVIAFLTVELSHAQRLGGSAANWNDSLDQALLMKVLPKLHGNRRKLLDSLSALAAFFSGQAAPTASYTLGADVFGIEPAEQLPQSLGACAAKTAELQRTLKASGYTTFIA